MTHRTVGLLVKITHRTVGLLVKNWCKSLLKKSRHCFSWGKKTIVVLSFFLMLGFMVSTSDQAGSPSRGLKQLASHMASRLLSTMAQKNGVFSTVAEEEEKLRGDLTLDEISSRFQRRLQTLRNACKLYANSSMFHPLRETQLIRLESSWPVRNVSFGYCSIEKTGSTTWTGLLKSIRQEMKIHGAVENQKISEKEVLFVNVREPYSRLLSGYADKLFSPNTYSWNRIGKYIIKKFRPNPSEKSLRCGHDVTFPEFIQYIIHSQETGEHRDGHFVPIHDHCSLCHVPYNHVGHLETLSEDMPYLLHAIQSPINITRVFDNDTILNNAGWVLKAKKNDIRKCMSMNEACLRLWKKWHIRGILSKTQPLPVTAEQAETISYNDFVQLSLQALARSGPKAARKLQKQEALKEAFAVVPLEDKLKIKKLLFLDFALFDFDPDLDFVFSSSPLPNDDGYSYLDQQT